MCLPTYPSTSLSRRCFLRTTAIASTAILAGSKAALAERAEFPFEPKQRLAVTSYPFRAYIESKTNSGRDPGKPGMDLKDFPAMVAERFGVRNINPLGDHLSSVEPSYLEAFRKSTEQANSRIVDLGIGGRDFSNSAPSVRDDAMAYGRKWIDIASLLGAPSIRQHLKSTAGVPLSVDMAAENLHRLADYGATRGIIVNLENDSPGAEDPFFIVDVVSKVNSPFLRALPDFGNSLRGHDAEYNRKAVSAMFRYAHGMAHVKDRLVTKDGQTYTVDVPGLFKVAQSSGYKGYFSMEFDTAAGDPFDGTKRLVDMSLTSLRA